ncbi:MAG: peptidylprolyl isomerase [Gemmatimonadales bacterium]
MISTGALVRTVLGLSVAATLAAQQPGSVTAPVAARPVVAAPLAPIGILLDRIVAVVGQTPILLGDVVDAALYLKGAGEAVPDPTDSVAYEAYLRDRLDDLINQDVLIAVAKQYKAEVDDKDITPDVDKRLKDLHARFKSDAEFRIQLKAEGFGSETELRNSLLDKRRNDLLQQMAMDSLRAHGKLAAPVNVTEAQVTAAFDKAKGKIGKRPATISFKQIVIAPKANPAARASAKAKADSLLVVLQHGGDFETIAKKESMDPTTRDEGGALPYARRGQMVAPFDHAIFTGYPPGTIVPYVVESAFGFHIIRIDRVQPAQVKSSHILIIPHLDSADVARAQLVADTVIRKWSTGTPYDTLVKYYHDPIEEKSEPDGFLVDSLPEEYRNALADVKKGQLSRAFQIPNPRTGMPKFVVVLVTDRTAAGDYTMADVRDKIRQQLVEEAQFHRMIEELRREQFVKIMM